MRTVAEICLHIGTHKTGTTSMQKTLQTLAPDLKRLGWHYLSGGPNHSWLYLLFTELPHREHDMIKRGLGEAAAAQKWVVSKTAMLAAELAGQTGRVLVSGEELCRLSEDGVKRMLEFFSRFTDTISAVCFVRDPISYCKSEAQENIKGGLSWKEVVENPPRARFRFYLKKYVEQLGREHVHVIRYEKFVETDFETGTARLLSAAGVDTLQLKINEVDHSNRAISQEAALILSELNVKIPMYINAERNPARTALPSSWLNLLGNTTFTLPRESLIKCLQLSKFDIEWLHSLVGEQWFNIDYVDEFENLSDKSLIAIDPAMAQNIGIVLNQAAILVRDCMCSALSVQIKAANAAGDIDRAQQHRVRLYALRPELEWQSPGCVP
jgi:hypothetical protein